MEYFENCKTLNDIARQEFGKANYTNREKCKKILADNGINWKEWLENKKIKEKRYCLNCGKELVSKTSKKFCSCSCAVRYNNSRREISEETRRKISEALQKKNPKFNGEIKPLGRCSINALNERFNGEKRYCEMCGKELKRYQEKFCSNECRLKHNYKQYIERWKSGKENGMKGEYEISNHIRKYLFEKNSCKCEKCGWGEKNEFTKLIPLEVHHIDGNYRNNKEENLQLLCPNCHSLTETYKSHNKNGRKKRKKYKN